MVCVVKSATIPFESWEDSTQIAWFIGFGMSISIRIKVKNVFSLVMIDSSWPNNTLDRIALLRSLK